MPSVLNKSKMKRSPRPGAAIYIGRPSIWGNPFVVGMHGTREEVIAKYEKRLCADPALLARLPELEGKDLVCWCAPLPCHGDVLIRLANKEKVK